jgi:hypothetical protein
MHRRSAIRRWYRALWRSGSPLGQSGSMKHDAVLVLRDLASGDYPVARRIISTAFGGEPFAVGMFGESPLDRFVGLAEQYESWPWATHAIVVGAEVYENLVGVA